MAPTTPKKRLFESAFTSSAPGMLVNAHRGFDAHLQAPSSPFTPSALFVPGQWPREQRFAGDAAAAPAARPSLLYTLGRWAVTATLGHVFALPARLMRRFARKQQVIVQTVVREDGAYKKRIIDAGPAEKPTTPTPAPRAMTKRCGRGRPRARETRAILESAAPSSMETQNATLPEQHSKASPEAPFAVPTSPDIWAANPTHAQAPVPHVSQSASSESPDIGLATPTPPTAQASLFSCTTPPWLASLLKKRTASSSLAPPQVAQNASDDVDGDVDMDADDSSEWSFEGAWTSPIPADQPADYLQPMTYTDNVVVFPPDGGFLWDSPNTSTPLSRSPLSGSPLSGGSNEPTVPSPQALHIAQASQEPLRGPHQISPNTHINIIRNASVTPMRKLLLKNQAHAQGAFEGNLPTNTDHTVPSPSHTIPEQTELQQQIYQAANLKNQAAEVASRAQQASEQYKAEAEARQNCTREISAAEQAYYNYAETIDQDLSFLSDAPDEDEDVQIPETPTPTETRRRSVRWSSHASAKTFYCDAKVADMMDSTLESIHSSPMRPLGNHYSESDTSEDDTADSVSASIPHRSNERSAQHNAASTESVGFRGVPSSTWDDSDDSLEESELSLELLGDLHKEIQDKLALAPPPPPVKALVEPLSEEEYEKLEAVAKTTENGRIANAPVVPKKTLNAHDFSTLLPAMFNGDPKAWLNDNIINEYIGILIAEKKKEAGFVPKKGGPAPSVHAFSSFWYPTMSKRKFQGVERWAAKAHLAGKQFLDADLILFPICDVGHWRLLAVKPKERTIEYLDSMKQPGAEYINQLLKYIELELKEAWVADEWTVLTKQRSTRQVNGSDCGVFTILNALALLRGEEFTKVLACNGMLDARERIATTLMAGEPTTEFT